MTGYQSKKKAASAKTIDEVHWADHEPNGLAQPEQEPLGGTREVFEKWAKSLPNHMDITRFEAGYSDCNTDYAWAGWQAAQRTWVDLTDEQILALFDSHNVYGSKWVEFARAVEAKLREKNT